MTMRLKKQLAGSILATVLVVSTLMLLGLFAFLALFDITSLLYENHRYGKQQLAYLDAAFLLYENDPQLVQNLAEKNDLQLFDDEPRSKVLLSRSLWGLYEIVRAASPDRKFRAARLFGQDLKHPPALYVCDNRRAVTFTGRTNIGGDLFIPDAGILYGQMQNSFFKGREIEKSAIKNSAGEFPSLNLPLLDSIVKWNDYVTEDFTGESLNVSFFDPTVVVQAERLREVILRGNIVIKTKDRMVIDSTAMLEDVIVIAPHVTVRAGFNGSMQILASDTVIIESRAALQYPSGIMIGRAKPGSYIELAGNSQVYGYVIINSTATAEESEKFEKTVRSDPKPGYKQSPKAKSAGLIFIDGPAQVQGTIAGTLFVNQPNYYTSQGFYTNTFHDLTVQSTDQIPYPFWFAEDYKRKTVKWID